MRGNEIIVNGTEPKGRFNEGYVGTGYTFYPGMAVQEDMSVALKGGRHTFKPYTRGADGKRPAGPIWIVTGLLGALIGKTATDSIPAGERVQVYCPVQGDELNLLLGDVAGTGDVHAAGEILIIDDTTGFFIATTGSPETGPAVLRESVAAPTANTLAWCGWSGY